MRKSEQHLPQKVFTKFVLSREIKGGFLKLENIQITFIGKYTSTHASLLLCVSVHFLIACASLLLLVGVWIFAFSSPCYWYAISGTAGVLEHVGLVLCIFTLTFL